MERKLKVVIDNCSQNHKCPAVNVCPNVIMRQGEGSDNYIILPAKELQWVLDENHSE